MGEIPTGLKMRKMQGKQIVLIGYMASGKSVIGKQLADKLNYGFVDLDTFIEQNENRTIKELFKTKGEIYFRKKETEYLNQLLQQNKSEVIALGGGTPCYGNNMETMLSNKNTVSIYLKASLKTLVGRLENESEKRPLISHIDSEEKLMEFVGKHLFERTPFYERAGIVVNVDDKTETDVVEDVLLNLY